MNLDEFKANITTGVRYRKDYDGRKYVLTDNNFLIVLALDKKTVITIYPYTEGQIKANKLVEEIPVRIEWLED